MSGMSSPRGLCTAPDLSDTATMIAPSLAIRSAATEPTFPNPCTATRAPLRLIPSLANASRVTNMHPRPVASRRPSEPPISTGFLERNVEIESDTALGRTTGRVVQHAVARVDLQLTRIAQHGDGHDDLLFGVAQHLVEAGIEVEELGGVIEALHHRFERVLLREERLLIGPNAEMTLRLDGGFAHGARWCVGSQGRRAAASTGATACLSRPT